jgi:hypothetical protein
MSRSFCSDSNAREAWVAPPRACPHGATTDPQRSGELDLAQTNNVVQLDDLPLSARQGLQTPAEHLPGRHHLGDVNALRVQKEVDSARQMPDSLVNRRSHESGHSSPTR